MITKQQHTLYFMPADSEDAPGIEVGDGRVLQLHPYSLDDSNDEENDYVSDLYRAIVHRYNNFEKALEALKAVANEIQYEHSFGSPAYTMCRRFIKELQTP